MVNALIWTNENGSQLKYIAHLFNFIIENTWSNSQSCLTPWSNDKVTDRLDIDGWYYKDKEGLKT